jgi:hypothetical protein
MNAVGSMFLDVQKVAAAFRGSGALAWGEHHPFDVLFDFAPRPLDLLSPKTPVGFENTIRGRFFTRKGAGMVSADTKSVIERAKRIYAEQLQAVLEPQHQNRFVAIEPESGEYFLGDTFDEAVKSAKAKHPSRLSHTIRIGHRAAFHIGGTQK